MSGVGAIGVTARQRDAWLYLTANPDASYREIGAAIGITGMQAVSNDLDELEAQGIIRKLERRARSIEVLHPAPVTIRGERYRFIRVGA